MKKTYGISLAAAILALCLLTGSAVSCRQEVPVEIAPVQLDLSFEYTHPDSLLVYGAEQSYTVPGAPVPVFVNGSCLTDSGSAAYVEDTPVLRTDLLAVARALYPNAGQTGCVIASDKEQCSLSCRMDRDEFLVEFHWDTGTVLLDGKEVSLSAEPEMQYTGTEMMLLLPLPDIAQLLHAEVTVLSAEETVYTGGADAAFSENALLYNTPHIQFWRYPAAAVSLTEEEALEIAEEQLILAYETSFGPFTPLEEKPADVPYPGDELYFRWQIPHLTVTGETDRFYRIAFVWDLLVDRYTGEVFTHYNGLAQSIQRFAPHFPAALAFAG